MVRIIGTLLPTMHGVWRHHVHSVAAVLVLYSVISVSYFTYLLMASETPRIYAMFGCKFTPGVEKMLPLIRKRRDPHKYIIIWLKKCQRSDGVSYNTSTRSSFCMFIFFNLVPAFMWNINKPSVILTLHKFGWFRINKNMYDQC